MSTTVSYLDPKDEERIITVKPGDRVSVTHSADRTLSRISKTGRRETSETLTTVYETSSVHMVYEGRQPSYVLLDPSSGRTFFDCGPDSIRVVVNRAGAVSKHFNFKDTLGYSLYPRKTHLEYQTFYTDGPRHSEPCRSSYEMKPGSDLKVTENGSSRIIVACDQPEFSLSMSSAPLSQS